MEITPNTALPEVSFPLPLYASETIASAKSSGGEEFEITIGLDKKAAEEIKKHALDENDEELLKNTSDRKRFGEGSYEKWYAKDRTPFCLVHKKTGALAAFAWFGPEPISRKSLENAAGLESRGDGKKESGGWHTIGYRSYKPFRGKGLMKDFMKFAIKIYSENRPGLRYWLGVKPENAASIALASSLGFTISEENSDRTAESLIMIK